MNIYRIIQTQIPDLALCTYWVFYAADKDIKNTKKETKTAFKHQKKVIKQNENRIFNI